MIYSWKFCKKSSKKICKRILQEDSRRKKGGSSEASHPSCFLHSSSRRLLRRRECDNCLAPSNVGWSFADGHIDICSCIIRVFVLRIDVFFMRNLQRENRTIHSHAAPANFVYRQQWAHSSSASGFRDMETWIWIRKNRRIWFERFQSEISIWYFNLIFQSDISIRLILRMH